MPALDACPTCGDTDLDSGVIVGRAPGVTFKPSQGVSGDLAGVRLTTGVVNHTAPAVGCAACGTVVVLPAR
ncbi:hypothetical protein GCM10022237_08420 [Nocardioides ginsengisoli]|uniref:Uncharacterized protein n=1 Tax=Nocardioides ginsengisoli TaxID=363868 RepID=A0ABW3VZX2_9ACTN